MHVSPAVMASRAACWPALTGKPHHGHCRHVEGLAAGPRHSCLGICRCALKCPSASAAVSALRPLHTPIDTQKATPRAPEAAQDCRCKNHAAYASQPQLQAGGLLVRFAPAGPRLTCRGGPGHGQLRIQAATDLGGCPGKWRRASGGRAAVPGLP